MRKNMEATLRQALTYLPERKDFGDGESVFDSLGSAGHFYVMTRQSAEHLFVRKKGRRGRSN
jgi:hypothetical protein